MEVVEKALQNVTEEMLLQEYPQNVFKDRMTTGYFLVHLAGHLNYHLGQINYHRRLLDGANKPTKYVYARTFL